MRSELSSSSMPCITRRTVPIDVRDINCDFLACSTYKFFGPHVGVLYGKREHLLRLKPYKVRPAADTLPDRWETGTLNHEGIAGVTACVEYLADIGRKAAARRDIPDALPSSPLTHWIQQHERELCGTPDPRPAGNSRTHLLWHPRSRAA